jgi:hypothetical protein
MPGWKEGDGSYAVPLEELVAPQDVEVSDDVS